MSCSNNQACMQLKHVSSNECVTWQLKLHAHQLCMSKLLQVSFCSQKCMCFHLADYIVCSSLQFNCGRLEICYMSGSLNAYQLLEAQC